MSRPTTVYRLFSGDELLYVGIAFNLAERLRRHMRREFWRHVDYCLAYTYVDRFTAERAEATAIATERPVFNIDRGTRAARSAPIFDGPGLWRQEIDYWEGPVEHAHP